jgi:hypothetical protein
MFDAKHLAAGATPGRLHFIADEKAAVFLTMPRSSMLFGGVIKPCSFA